MKAISRKQYMKFVEVLRSYEAEFHAERPSRKKALEILNRSLPFEVGASTLDYALAPPDPVITPWDPELELDGDGRRSDIAKIAGRLSTLVVERRRSDERMKALEDRVETLERRVESLMTELGVKTAMAARSAMPATAPVAQTPTTAAETNGSSHR